MADVLKEAIRIVLETEGREGVEQLRKALAGVGDVSEEMLAPTNRLVDNFNELNDAAGRASELEGLGKELAETELRLDEASRAALALTLEFGSVAKPSRAMTAGLKAARDELARLEAQQKSQASALSKATAGLKAAGVNTERLADEQARLRAELRQTAAAIAAQAEAVRRQAEANRLLKARLAEGDEQFRRMTAANRASSDALRAYRDRAAAAAKETADLGREAGRTVGVMGRLTGVFAGLLGVLSLRSAIDGVKNLVGLGDAAERVRIRLEALYGTQEAGNRAYADLQKLARDNALRFDELLEAAAKLKSFGLEPLDGTLQGLIDQNAKLGGSNEKLNGIILAIGQAWAKQKLQGEEILQLVERGVPVWDLLAKATGKNVQELQRLSERGELTRETIRLLINEIAEGAQGAAAAQLNTFSALYASLLDRLKRFFTNVSERGVLGFFKQQLAEINTQIDELAASGKLQAYAQAISNTIVSAAKSVRDSTVWLVEHRGALLNLAKAFALLKLGNVIASLWTYGRAMYASAAATLALARSATAASGVLGGLRAILSRIPGGIVVTLVLAGLAVLWEGIKKAQVGFAELVGWNDKLAAAQRKSDDALRVSAAKIVEAAGAYAKYKDTVVLTAEQVAKLSAEEVAGYRERLEGLNRYQAAQATYLSTLITIGDATAAQREEYARLREQLDHTHAGFTALDAGLLLVENAFKHRLTPQAEAFLQQLKGIEQSAKTAMTTLSGLFDAQNFRDSNRLGDLSLAIAEIAQQGRGADRSVRDGLLATLQKLSGEELLRFQAASIAAFDSVERGSEESAAVLETTLLAAMQKLGVAPERLGVAFTEMGQEAVAAFNTVLENANATSAQIEASFKAALSHASTPEEAKALGALLKQAGLDGKLGFDASERAASALRDRILEISNALNPLADDFRKLGIVSQAELNRARDAARASFQAIVDGSDRSRDALNDVRRAFIAYAQAELATVRGTDAAAQQRVASELRVLASVNGVTEALRELGVEGAEAGRDIAAGADRGTAALERTSDVAGRTATNLSSAASAAAATGQNLAAAGDAADGAASGLRAMGREAGTTTFAMGDLSEAAVEAYSRVARLATMQPQFVNGLNAVSLAVRRQQDAVAQLSAAYDAQLKQLDPLARELENLKRQYRLVDEGALRQVAEKEQRVKSERQRLEAERRAARKEREEAAADAAGDGATPPPSRSAPTAATPRNADAGRTYTVHLQAGERSIELFGTGSPDAFESFMDEISRQRAVSTGGRG